MSVVDNASGQPQIPTIQVGEEGYLHPEYAAALAEFGRPRSLSCSKAWILVRPVPGSSHHDAMGCYPLFSCQNWSHLQHDLGDLAGQLLCLSVVTDPFGQYDVELLVDCFRDVVRPFKQHYVVDLTSPMSNYVSAHHRRNARRALRDLNVEHVEKPSCSLADEWVNLYANLISRHGITGISAFSPSSLALQLSVPCATVFRARHKDQTVGMIVWYVSGNIAYYHLAAYNDLGYELRASFALFWSSIEFFRASGLRWLNLGAGAGLDSDATDGLSRFKRGWSTGIRTAYFCGKIFDRQKYADIVKLARAEPTDYFPAYRVGEYSSTVTHDNDE